MHPENSTAETATVEVHKELLLEMQRRGSSRRHDFVVEGWQPSFFERLKEKLTGGK